MPLNISLESVEELRARKLVEVYNKYYSVCNCIDPETGKVMYVDCLVGGVTYRMNAGKLASNTMKEGIELAEAQGFTAMPEVRDFNNVNWANVSVVDAREINKIQGVDAYMHWAAKCAFIDSIRSATTSAGLLAINVLFVVSTV